MKKLKLNQMQNIQAKALGRDCMIDGAVATIGLFTIYYGGWSLIVGSVAHAASVG